MPDLATLAAIARARRAAWTPEKRAEVKVKARIYRQTHREAIRARNLRYQRANREWAREYARRWAAENRERAKEFSRRWHAANPESAKARRDRRRTLEVRAFVADVDVREVFDRCGGICHICEQPVDWNLQWVRGGSNREYRSLDHLIPLALGGTHEPANVALAHKACNSGRGARL